MSRILLVVLINCLFTLNACAQWYKIFLGQKHTLQPMYGYNSPKLNTSWPLATNNIPLKALNLFAGQQAMDVEEQSIIKVLRKHMRVHNTDSTLASFNRLAGFYWQHGMLSAAKWYLLQCGTLAQKANKPRQLMHAMVDLALVKCQLGDYNLALPDLQKASLIAQNNGYLFDYMCIEGQLPTVASKCNSFWYAPEALPIDEKEW